MSPDPFLCYSEEPDVAVDLVRLARSLADPSGTGVRAVVPPGAPADLADRLAAGGAHGLEIVPGPAESDPQVLAATLAEIVRVAKPGLLLFGSTKRGREVAGRLAGLLDLPALTGATAVRLEGESVRVEREALSGDAVAIERIPRGPAIVAVLPGTTGPAPAPVASVERREHPTAPPPPLTERTEVRTKPGGQLEIEKAERIVTIGRGLRKKEDLTMIEALARALGAEVGCTRPLAAEAGWLSDDHWIGLTGHRVHPKLYVALGVSGAVQHLVGMRSARIVVAVNRDANAPIFAQADYKIVGDLYQIVPALLRALGG